MKSQILALINQKPSAKRISLLSGVVFTIANCAISLPVGAQDSFLPPEVIPVSQAINYGSTVNQYGNAQTIAPTQSMPMAAPGMNTQGISAQAMQTPQEARQALYHSLMGNNVYPQFNGQAPNQSTNLTGNNNNMNANQSFNPSRSFNDGTAQTLNNQMPSTTNMPMAQNNMNNVPATASPSQAQTLSGNVASQNTSQQRTTGGISHLAGVVSGVGLSGVALAGMRSPGGIFSAGLLGAGLMNYGLRSGFKF